MTYFPRWLCKFLFGHCLFFRWADYAADEAGLMCRCGWHREYFRKGYKIEGGMLVKDVEGFTTWSKHNEKT